MSGVPGSPEQWFAEGRAGQALDAFAEDHRGLAPITVAVDANGAVFKDTLCVDSPATGDKVMTYLAEDVPAGVAKLFDVDPDPARWAIAGLSRGGSCALQMSLTRPGTYPTFLSMSPQKRPVDENPAETVATYFRGDRKTYDAIDPLKILETARFGGSVHRRIIAGHRRRLLRDPRRPHLAGLGRRLRGVPAVAVRPIGVDRGRLLARGLCSIPMRPELSAYSHLTAGKVREIYEIDDDTLLMVVSDRISAYDHILDTPIPDKGRVLTAMSVFFFDELDFPNHLAGPADDERIPAESLGRALVCKKLEMLPFECVARGYLTGSGLAEYRESGTVCGIELPEGLVEGSKLPEPIFTPATKAEIGDHDENVPFSRVVASLGEHRANELRDATLSIYSRAAELALERGIILADTKFEFGLDADGGLVLADEVLTPDSSRYWPADSYVEGQVNPSFDKQYVRNWLTSPKSGWDKNAGTPPPPLPGGVVEATRERYIEAYERISGRRFSDWIGDPA